MTLKGDATFKGKLICCLKNHKRNLVNFHTSSRTTENLHCDQIHLFKAYKDLDEKSTEELCFMKLKSDAKLEEKLTLHSKSEFSPNHSKVQKLIFDGLFLFKIYEIWAKKIQSSYLLWHWTVMQNLNKL